MQLGPQGDCSRVKGQTCRQGITVQEEHTGKNPSEAESRLFPVGWIREGSWKRRHLSLLYLYSQYLRNPWHVVGTP